MGELKLRNIKDTAGIMEWFTVSRDTVNRWRHKYGLPYYKLGSKVMFDVVEVERWLKERKING